VNGDLDGCTPSQRIALLRVVRESLSNVGAAQRYGQRKRSVVSANETELSGRDRRRRSRFDVEAAREAGRLGLVGMSERIRLLDGTLELESRPGGRRGFARRSALAADRVLGCGDPAAERVARRLGAAADAELAVDVRQVELHRLLGDPALLADRLVESPRATACRIEVSRS
jgi:hypothetical protein